MLLLKYLLIINIISGIIFFIDKQKSKKKKYRISEFNLHLLEILGGIFIILPLIILIRHKNKKASYFLVSWFIFILWIMVLYIYFV